MKHNIEYDEVEDENGVFYLVNLIIDDNEFLLDRGDLWNLYTIINNCFERIEGPEENRINEIKPSIS